MRKKLMIVAILIALVQVCYAETKPKAKAKIPEPRGGRKKPDLTIKDWNPPTSLATHFGKGSDKDNSPIFSFNLNLGYARFFMKSDVPNDTTYLYNSGFSYIIEIRPLDFVSFLSSGSEYAIYMEQTEILRNLTFITSNKTYSSTQFLTSKILWYFDFIYNAIDIRNIIIPQSKTSQSALENLYPINRKESVGIADRIHFYQTDDTAIGLVCYFEFLIPSGTQQVAKGPLAGELTSIYSSRFTYSGLVGLFYRYTDDSKDLEMNASLIYQRLAGDYDGWVITVTDQTLSLAYEVIWQERYFAFLKYYFINWVSDEYEETVYSHSLDLGVKVKGLGAKLEWIGLGMDFLYQNMEQTRGQTFLSNLNGIGMAYSASWFPLGFHKKNNQLEISLIYGLFNYDWVKNYYASAIKESGGGWAYSYMIKIDYSF